MPFLKNIAWHFIDKALTIIVSLYVTIVAARHLGPSLFGEYAFWLNISAIIFSAGTLGIKEILIKSFNKNENLIDVKIKSLLKFFLMTSALVYSFLIAIFILIDKHNIYIVSIFLVMILSGYVVFEAYFMFRIKQKEIAKARLSSKILTAFIITISALWDLPLFYFVASIIAEYTLFTILLFRSCNRDLKIFETSKQRSDFSIAIVKRGIPILFSTLAIFIFMRTDIIMLKFLNSGYSVGVYSASTRIVEAFYVIPIAIASTYLPLLDKLYTQSQTKYDKKTGSIFVFTIALSIVLMSFLLFSAEYLILFIYGVSFLESVGVLKIYIFCFIPVVLGAFISNHLIISKKRRILIFRSWVAAILNIVLNYFLIPAYAEIGAAIATLISYFSTLIVDVVNKDTRKRLVMWTKLGSVSFMKLS